MKGLQPPFLTNLPGWEGEFEGWVGNDPLPPTSPTRIKKGDPAGRPYFFTYGVGGGGLGEGVRALGP